MPVRSLEEFAREAPSDGPFELEIGSGKQKRKVAPKPVRDLTRHEQLERARIEQAWAAASGSVDGWPPRTPSGVAEMESTEFLLRARFGALKPHAPTDDDPRTLVAADTSPDFELFWSEIVMKLPWTQVGAAMVACDDYYNPDPSTDEERMVAAATRVLEQAQLLMHGGDADIPGAKDLLAEIDATVERAAAVLGKSGTAGS